MELKIEYLPIEQLKPYNKNTRKHQDLDIDNIAKSIEQFGMCDAIGIWGKDNVIVEGHGRMMACKKLGINTVPCVRLDHLTDEQRRKYAIAHNATAELSIWDKDFLAEELAELDMSDFDFDFDIDSILDEGTEVVEDEVPEVDEEAEPITKLGDIWQLGRHRLMCGDSTDTNTFNKIMCGEKAEIAFTSPPYNADHLDVAKSEDRGGGTQKSTQKKYLADNDKRTDDEYFEFLRSNIELLIENADEVFYNIGVAAGSKRTIATILSHFADKFKELLYWQKQNPMPVISENVISSSTELIIAFGNNNSRALNHFNDRLFHGVISGLSAATTNEYADIHKATFPLYLPVDIITRFTSPNGMVIDCFGGTGTTMIACEQTGRACRMIELDPRYCDVIIKRWETLTGEKAVLVNG